MCRNEEWIECSTNFAQDVMVGGEKLKQWHPWLRPLAQYFVPEMARIRGDHQRALELCKYFSGSSASRFGGFGSIKCSFSGHNYVLEASYISPEILHLKWELLTLNAAVLPELEKRSTESTKIELKPRNDMIEWMQQRAKKLGDDSFDSKELANLQMLTATAAIHTTRLAIIHALYDLAARPEYIEPLREEVFEVTKDNNGRLRKQHLTQMRKLDSFMKESQRHNPPSVGEHSRPVFVHAIYSPYPNLPFQQHFSAKL